MSQARQILQKSSIYAAGNVLRGLASFLMLPIYTRYLTPKDYGIIELIGVVLDLTLLLLGARVAVGIFKFYSDAETTERKNQVIATALALMCGVHLAAVGVITAFNQPLSAMLDAAPDFGIALAVYSLSAVFNAANEVYYSYLKILDRAFTYVGINLAKLVLQLTLNIVLIVYFDLKYWGVIWSAVITSVAMTTFFSLWFIPQIGFRVSRYYAKQLVQFSLPIILASLAMYYITFSSRYYLEFFDGINAVGIYALANKFGMMIFTLVAIPFSEYWSARQFDMARTPGADKLFGQVFFYLVLVMLCAAAGLMALITDFVHISATSAYWPALPIIPWLIGAFMLQAWGDYFRFGCFFLSKNRYITYASIVTVVAVTLAYVSLIPEEGALGAGKAMFIASLIRFLVLYYYGQRLFHMEVPWLRVLGCVLYFAAVVYVLNLIPLSGLQAILVKGGLAGLSCLIVFTTPLIDLEHRKAMYRQLSGFLARTKTA